MVLRSVWSISGLLPPPSPDWAGERNHCSQEQYDLAQTIEKLENQMRPEDSHYKTKKPYMRVVKTNKTKEKLNKTNKTKEKPKKTIEKPMNFKKT